MAPKVGSRTFVLCSLLLAGALAGCVSDDGGGDDLAFGSETSPAASQVFERGLTAEEPAFQDGPMAMKISAGLDGTEFMSGEFAYRPDLGDCMLMMTLDMQAAAEAYGADNEMSGGDGAMFGLDPEGNMQIAVGRVGPVQVIGFGAEVYGLRDFVPDADDDVCALSFDQDHEADQGAPEDVSDVGPSPWDSFDMFIESEAVDSYTVTLGEWQGVEAYVVDAMISDEGVTAEATFYFRASDVAPLHMEADFDGWMDEETIQMLQQQDPNFEPAEKRMQMTLDFTYGKSVTVSLPDEFIKIAVAPTGEAINGDSRYTMTLSEEHSSEVPLDEIELRVVTRTTPEFGFGSGEIGTVHATFDPSEGSGTVDGFTFEYDDADGDGMLSAGDTYTVDSPTPQFFNDISVDEEGSTQTTVLVYDEWAGDYEGSPGPAIALLAAALVGLAAYLGRRRT